MASSSKYSFLMIKGSSGETYTKLVDIKSYPDMGGAPNMITTTTLSDDMEQQVPGVKKADALEFTHNYSAEDYDTLNALDDGKPHDFALWLGGTKSGNTVTPTGDEGKFNFSGRLSVYMTGAGVDDAREMKSSIALSSAIVKAS